MIREENFTPEMVELYETMSDISEDCYYAGWMHGLEYAIWGALQDGDRRYGAGDMDAKQLEKVRQLSAALNGWIIWFDDDDDASLPVEEWGPRFIDSAEWAKRREVA